MALNFSKNLHLLAYAAAMAVLLFLLKWLQWRFFILDHSTEIFVGAVALLFTFLGIWLAQSLTRPKVETVVVEREVPAPAHFETNQKELEKLQLTEREWDVLQCMSRGMSNAEIAADLHLSVSTVKTHASNIFQKMDVSSRAKALEKAKRLRITP